MAETLLWLFIEFFKTGLFAVGGGMATVPFLYDIAARYDWFDAASLADMIAISESTPGPIGINAATYAGFSAAGIPGALVATFALVLPSFIIIMIIAGVLQRFSQSRAVGAVFSGIRPVAVGLIAAAALRMVGSALVAGQNFTLSAAYFSGVNWIALVLTGLFAFAVIRWKKHPILYIACGAVLGIGLGAAGLL